MKSCIYIWTADGDMIQVEEETAQLSPTLYQAMQSGGGRSTRNPICTPVARGALDSIFDYLVFYSAPEHSHKEHKPFDVIFSKKDAETLCLMIGAAGYLKLEQLADELRDALVCGVLSSSESKQDFINFTNNLLQQAEESEHCQNPTGDSRHVKILGAKKKKQLDRQKKAEADKGAQKNEDTRSISDLMAFIDGDSKGPQTSTRKKKNRTKRNKQKNTPSVSGSASTEPSSSITAIESHGKDQSTRDVETHSVEASGGVSDRSRLLETEVGRLTLEDEPDDGGFDHAWNEKIDREVQDFAQSLNLVLEDTSLLSILYNKKE